MHTLTIPLFEAERAARSLLRGQPHVDRALTVISRTKDTLAAFSAGEAGTDGPGLLVRLLPLAPGGGVEALLPTLAAEIQAVVRLGLDGNTTGRARAWLRGASGDWNPNVLLRLPGPGMPNIFPPDCAPAPLTTEMQERWSRTLAALGMGALQTLQTTTVGCVGLGKLGSALVRYLAGLPIERLVLVDPDKVQPHNTGEGGAFGETDTGRHKVQVLQDQLALWRPEIEVEAWPLSVTQAAALHALSSCDVLFSMSDDPGARLAPAAVAVCHHIPLIDIGTTVHLRPVQGESMGADIRLVIPSHRRGCLLCQGSVHNEDAGRRILASPDFEVEFTADRDWRSERRGSLNSLNLLAVGAATRLWEMFLSGSCRESTWWHLSLGDSGTLRTESVVPTPTPTPLCACSLAGKGKTGLSLFGGILRRRAELLL